MDSLLSLVTTDVDFSFLVERDDGRKYVYNRGGSTPQTVYESASTSKLVTAVIILHLVDQGYLKLSDKPQDYISASNWPIDSKESLYNMTLAHLLSFTAGLTDEPFCITPGNPFLELEEFVKNIALANTDNGAVPGQKFSYSGSYLQVAGLMGVKAKSASVGKSLTWQDIFTAFKSETGLFTTSAYDLPSKKNPRLAGGMHWTSEEYLAFLKALKKGQILSPSLMTQITSDQTASALIVNSPPRVAPPGGIGEDWHYGFGIWLECQSSTFNCATGGRVSSPGSYGGYPFWDQKLKHVGIVGRQGAQGTYPNGINIERAVRSKIEEWVACSNR